MTFFNLVGLVMFAAIVIAGVILRVVTHKRLKSLEGFGGLNKKGNRKGNLISINSDKK